MVSSFFSLLHSSASLSADANVGQKASVAVGYVSADTARTVGEAALAQPGTRLPPAFSNRQQGRQLASWLKRV